MDRGREAMITFEHRFFQTDALIRGICDATHYLDESLGLVLVISLRFQLMLECKELLQAFLNANSSSLIASFFHFFTPSK